MNPTQKTIERIAKVFGVAPVELMGGHTNGTVTGRKPGPPSRLQQLTDKLSELPRQKQKAVIEILEGYLKTAAPAH